ncbi:MAG: hypothetical protein R3A13_09080 [Bdellovibrionota bacterium]
MKYLDKRGIFGGAIHEGTGFLTSDLIFQLIENIKIGDNSFGELFTLIKERKDGPVNDLLAGKRDANSTGKW